MQIYLHSYLPKTCICNYRLHFTNEPPFDASLFVEFRKRLGMENVNAINERIVALKTHVEALKKVMPPPPEQETVDEKDDEPPENKGRVIFDATACPQDIAWSGPR